MKHPVIGKLYEFELSADVSVHLTPVEYAKTGPLKGALMCYVFKPEITAEQLYANASVLHFACPPLLTVKQYFKEGTLKYIESQYTLKVPFVERQAFSYNYDIAMRPQGDLYDINHQKLEVKVFNDPIADYGIYTLAGVCSEIKELLNLNIDCSVHYPNREVAEKDMQLPADDYVNKRSMQIAILISGDDDACVDPDQDVSGIEDALMEALYPEKLGSCEGDASSETDTELYLKIRSGKYPQAIIAIRKALQSVGVLKYRMLWSKD